MSAPVTSAATSTIAVAVEDDRLSSLQEELATVIRVRHRLAQTSYRKDPHHLERVWKTLLPRLLRHLDKNALALVTATAAGCGGSGSTRRTSDDNATAAAAAAMSTTMAAMASECPCSHCATVELRQQIQQQLLGTILSRSNDEAITLTGGGGVCEEDGSLSWVDVALADWNVWESSVTLTVALTLFEQASSSLLSSPAAMRRRIPPLMDFVNGQVGMEVVTASQRNHLQSATWLLLDAISLSSGMKLFSDWDLIQDDALVPWSQLENMVELPTNTALPERAAAAHKTDGAGVFQILLDLWIFWPAAQTAAGANSTGLSLEGVTRMNYKRRGALWNELFLLQLKYVCFSYAVGTPSRPGLFYGTDRALLLAVLFASGSSMHGRLATNYLNRIHGTDKIRLLRQSGGAKKNEAKSSSVAQATCSLSLAVALLVLMLGDDDSAPVLRQYAEISEVAFSILESQPVETAFRRTALPAHLASRAAQFIIDHFRPPVVVTQDRQGLRLFLDLVVVLQDHHGMVYWGMQLMQNVYNELRMASADDENDEWVRGFYQRCLQAAKAVAMIVPDSATNEVAGEPLRPDQMPAGGIQPFHRRQDLDMLLRDHRVRQNRKRLSFDGAIKARKAAYNIIKELSLERYLAENCDNKMSFDIPIILLQCAHVEDETMQPYIARAMGALLSAYKQIAARGKSARSLATDHQVAALLPSLVSAACADSAAARLVVAHWASDFLADMDFCASLHICMFLSDDFDPFVSKIAKKALPKLKMMAGDGRSEHEVIDMLDVRDRNDLATLTRDLDMLITLVATEAQIEKVFAYMILLDFGFSTNAAIHALREDRNAVLAKSGLLLRYNERDMMDWEKISLADLVTCGICYDGGVDSYSMLCGHSFCKSCWHSYLALGFQRGPSFILNATCPQHDCSERLTTYDMDVIQSQLGNKWNDVYFSSFLDHSEQYRRCTGPDCWMVAAIRHFQVNLCRTVTCTRCDTPFCFACGNAPHEPAGCNAFQEWNRIFGSSTFWVKKNAKFCPSCKVPIEKNDGCNHMTCSQCGADFCWLCLSLLQMHLQAHTCNRYDPVVGAEQDDELRAIFFTDRFQAHDDAEMYAKDKLKVLKENATSATDMLPLMDEEAFEVILKAWEVQVSARQFLKWSYVASWALRHDASKLDVFTMAQATLELVTERLNLMALVNVESVYRMKGEHGMKMHFRAIGFLRSTVSRYQLRIRSLG